jgi:hypothetical protein
MLLVVTLVLGNGACLAQTPAEPRTDVPKVDAGGTVRPSASCDLMSMSPTAATFAVHSDFLAAMRRSNACLADAEAGVSDKARCAESANTELAALVQSPGEQALLVMQRAGVAALQGDDEAARRLYAEALAPPGIEPSIRRLVASRYTSALLANGEPASGLRVLQDNFDCSTWTADALALRGTAYGMLFATTRATESYAAAIRLFGLEHKAVPPALQTSYEEVAKAERKTPSELTQAADGEDVVPALRIPPRYPREALQRGLADSRWKECGPIGNSKSVT